MNAPVALTCPRCGESVRPDDLFCEVCSADLSPQAAVVAAPQAPGVAGMGAIGGGARAAEGDEIGGVDAESIRFDAAAAGPPRRPGVLVRDTDLTLLPSRCPNCDGRIAPDGYCEQCGSAATRPRDHWAEQPASWVAMVCDRGIRHAINQDGAAIGAAPDPGSFMAMVICDGVSSAARSEIASLAGARSARDVLVAPREVAAAAAKRADEAALADPHDVVDAGGSAEADAGGSSEATREIVVGSSSLHSKASALAGAMRAAGAAAQEQAVAASEPDEHNPPACTFVAAVLQGTLLVVGWVGDSRAYWLPDTGIPLQLSTDDSWAGEAMALGFSREEAERAPQAHSITRWLGRDAPDPVPRTMARRLETPGWLMLCSDGLWNYCSEAVAMRELVTATLARTGPDPAALADGLVAWANEQGGHDNIAVSLARIG